MGVATIAALTTLLGAQDPWAPDRPEPGSVDAIARFTTEPRFLSPWVAGVPDSPTILSPRNSSVTPRGAPGELSTTTQIYS